LGQKKPALKNWPCLGRNSFSGSIDLPLELVAAFCLGEVAIPEQIDPSLSAFKARETKE